MTATRIGNFRFSAALVRASNSRPDAEDSGASLDRKAFLNGSTSLAGSPFARAPLAATPAASASTSRTHLTRASCKQLADRVRDEEYDDDDGRDARAQRNQGKSEPDGDFPRAH